jgi:hypothetical protein
MRIRGGSRVALLGATVLGCLGALADCGGSGSGGAFPGGDDGGSSDHDATTDDGAPDGPETVPPVDGSHAGDDGPDATLGDGGVDAAIDSGVDATVEAGTIDSGVDAAPDGGLDAGPDASVDGGLDGSLDGSSEASLEAGPSPIPCDAQASCNTDASTVQCCSGFCVDTARDPANCGQCGNGCTANQFCTGTACDDAIIANVCGNPNGTVVFDPYDVDNEAGASMGAALHAVCVPATSIVQLPQDAGGVLDPSGSGRPITGVGNTFITGGGPFGQVGNAYMELQANLTPIYLQNNGTNSRILTRAGTEVLNVLDTALGPHDDYFYVQLAVEPQSGTLCFSGVGIGGPGSQAAGYYAATELIPNRVHYPASWYVYKWHDANNDSIAGADDMYTQIAAGP